MHIFKTSITAFLIFICANVVAQSADADKITGTFMTEGGKGKVSISRACSKYLGTLIWTNVPDAKNINNPDERKRSNKIAGTLILKNFVYTGDQTW